MNRIKCIVSYDGSSFFGFQIQNNVRTIQGEIQKALQLITKEEILIHASGRTDAKVHALKQVFHFDTSKELSSERWKQAINHFLPNDIYLYSCEIVDLDFHSRYSAVRKEYRYYLNTNEYNPLKTNYIYQYNRLLEVELMKDMASYFLGTHDFASFCAKDPYGNTIRTLYNFEINEKNGIIEFKLIGNGFRRYMVRHIVGALIQVGANRISKEKVVEMLDSAGVMKCLFKAKPQGLYLYQVEYER
jgi:pseudouridylate synthase I